jgi:hypothetical protein
VVPASVRHSKQSARGTLYGARLRLQIQPVDVIEILAELMLEPS